MSENIELLQVVMLADGRMDAVNAGRYLGLSPKTLAMMRSKGTGPKFMKVGRIFYRRCDLDAWIATRPCGHSTGEVRLSAAIL